MLTRLVLFFAAALTAFSSCASYIEIGATSSVAVQVTVGGRPSSSENTFELIDPYRHKPIPLSIRNGVAEQVPYGEYLLSVRTQGAFHFERLVKIQQPTIVFRVDANASIMECPVTNDSLHGTVIPAPENRELWLKAIPVYGTGGGEAQVGSHGNFLIGGLVSGQYVLMLMEGATVLQTQVVRSSPDRVLTLRLDSSR